MDDVGDNFIVWGEEANEADEARLGGKASGLRRMDAHGLSVPAWFVIAPPAFVASLTEAERDALAMAEGDEAARAVVATVAAAPELSRQIANAVARLRGNEAGNFPVAVRSSAMAEDGAARSWAGQFESFLQVAPPDVPARVADVWRSAFAARVTAYQEGKGVGCWVLGVGGDKTPSADNAPSLSATPPLLGAAGASPTTEPEGVLSHPTPNTQHPTPFPVPAVLVQRMVNARASGVAFSADPVTGRRGVALVAAVRGTGDKLVGGDVTGDTFRMGRGGVVLERTLDSSDAKGPAITEAEALAVADLARRAERAAGRPQDIEWAIDEQTGALWLLQSRAITTLEGVADPDAPRVVWDNSNIAESYNGVTTPLTFSFARNAYEHVYRTFCRLLSVPERRIEASDTVFRNMIGLRAGRVYYNLPNWYRALALLPGYQMNRAFMEQMMGVRGSLPDEVIEATATNQTPPLWERMRDGANFARSVASLVRSHATLPRQVARFHARLAGALGTDDGAAAARLALMRPDELAAHYRELESQLLSRWDAPLVNDFFAMIFHGVLRRVSEKWLPADQASLHNDLVSGDGGIVSAEPARRVRDMARLLDAMERPDLTAALCDLPAHRALRRVREDAPALADAFDAYLARFGDRCLEELKLESPTLHDDPTSLVRAVGRLAQSLATNEAALAWKRQQATKDPSAQGLFYLPHPFEVSASGPRHSAETVLRQSLARRPLRRAVYNRTLATARYHVRTRENLRFERTRVFGRVRRLCIEMGKRLSAQNRLDDPRDVFYLETHEVLGAVEGTLTCDDLRGLVAVRRAATDKHRALPAPPDRFAEEVGVGRKGVGCWVLGVGEEGEAPPAPNKGGAKGPTGAASPSTPNSQHPTPNTFSPNTRVGIACCPGVVRGRARVIRDPRGAILASGDILVAERTDPGWILLFPLAGGVVVERGSLLSHSAIVARELGIPCVVGVAGVMAWLRDGDEIEMDGASGTVRRISANEAMGDAGEARDGA